MENKLKEYVETILCEMDTIKSRLELHAFDETDNETYLITLLGGLNGRGQFLFYMDDVSEFVKRLLLRFNHAWLVSWNENGNDTFELKICVSFD